MADQGNPGQFGNREDTDEMARKGGEGGGSNRTISSRARGAAGKTEAAKKGGKHSGRRSR